jgi:hypothetical protein
MVGRRRYKCTKHRGLANETSEEEKDQENHRTEQQP